MIHTLLGAELFRKGMDLYFERHDGEAATVEQFVQCFADVSGRDLTQFMRWYSQAGTPEVVGVAATTTPARRPIALDLAQVIPPTPGQPTKEPMVIPLVTGLLGRDGRDLPLTLADGRQASSAACWCWTRPRRLHRLHRRDRAAGAFDQPQLLGADQAHRQSRARTICGCWRRTTAIRSTAGRRCRRWRARSWSATWRGCAPARTRRLDEGLLDALAAILADHDARAGLHRRGAQPAERSRHRPRDRPRRRSRCDLPRPRGAARADRAASQRRADRDLSKAWPTAAPTARTRRAPAAALLKNVCLDLLAATQESHAIRLAAKQYQAADNMTDRMAALATLSLHDVPGAQGRARRFLRSATATTR